MKGKIFEIKNAMVTFIPIEYSEPKILTRVINMELAPTFTIIFSYPHLSQRKISSSSQLAGELTLWHNGRRAKQPDLMHVPGVARIFKRKI